MSIIPCGKSNLFKSELDGFKTKYASKYVQEAMDSIEELEVESKCSHGHDASSCENDCEEIIVKKKINNKPLKKVIKEGDEFESHSSLDPRYITIAELKQTVARMNDNDKEKLTSYWIDLLGEEWTKALVKEYF